MCQVTAGTTKDLAYGKCTDCGFHHNHSNGEINSTDTDEHNKIFQRLPSDGLMRVVTLVLSTGEGTNATLQFTEPDSKEVVMSLETSHNWHPYGT